MSQSAENDVLVWHAPSWVIAGEYPFPPGHYRECVTCGVREGWPAWHRVIPPGEPQ